MATTVFQNSKSRQRWHQVMLISCFLLLHVFAFSQSGFYIPKQGKVFFAGDTATIFSNVINNGKLGVDKNAVVNFRGAVWENDPNAVIADETDSTTGTGGWIRFINNTAPQRLRSGYNTATRTGASFPNLQIANPFGVQLVQSSAKVRHQLSFERGLVYLNNNVFVVGHHSPGKITGYSETKFFVTGTQPGGLLLRENIRSSDSLVVFPIGTKAGNYSPAAIQTSTTQGDDFYVTVSEGVRSALFNGTNLASEGVNLTWQAGKLRYTDTGNIDLYLQHQVRNEGINFAKNRNKSFISQYLDPVWDTGPKGAPAAGILTTAPVTATGGLHHRKIKLAFGKPAYFTKLVVPETNIIWGAYRLDRATVVVNWQTKPEINVRYFVVQRRLSTETSFTSVTAATSKALNGISLGYLNYTTNDPNSYKGISYYRLQVFDYNGQSYYTNIVAVNSDMGNKIVLWPNPTTGPFSVLANSPLSTSMVIYNALGQRLYAKPINVHNQSVVEVTDHRLIPGVYFIAILDKEGNVLDGTKLIIQQ